MKTLSHHSNRSLAILIFFILISGFAAQAQMDAARLVSDSPTGQPQLNPWLANLYEIGVGVKGDSLIISDEAKQVATNAELRKIIYPAEYTWKQAQALLVQMQIKVGTWYLINLYAQGGDNKKNVLQYVLALDQKVDMDRILVSSFYTYIFFDPQASSIVNGKPDIQHPDILENKLAVIREISTYIQAARNTE